ncbi:MAG: glycine cleavage system aminomethyltransferase T [Gammaproteobacteria bacterium]|jgi:glycine cleavage system aminomethyltransferase T
MHESLLKTRFTIKALPTEGVRPHHLAAYMKVHPLSYMELPFDPEYSLYNNRMTPERLNNVTDDEQYWAVRQKVILRNTGEFPVQISGPDAENFANRVFAREVSGVKVGRCSYNFALYHNGCMITDGVMLRLAEDEFWMAQADGELTKWYMAHIGELDVSISDPNVWVSQVQGPHSMDLLRDVIDGDFPDPWRYFDMSEVVIAGESVIITRTGFSNELGWEFYLRPENNAEIIGNYILEKGQKYGMVLTGTPVFRARRIEAGLLSPTDFGDMTTPFEAGLGHFINMDKPDFIGREALEIADKRNRTFGMRVRGSIAERGRSILINGVEVGKVCSSTWSPFQECGVGIVRMDDLATEAGLELGVRCIDGEIHSAQLCSLPMYDSKGGIVRGKNTVIPSRPEPWVG